METIIFCSHVTTIDPACAEFTARIDEHLQQRKNQEKALAFGHDAAAGSSTNTISKREV